MHIGPYESKEQGVGVVSIRLAFIVSGILHTALFAAWWPEKLIEEKAVPALVERVTVAVTMLKPAPPVPPVSAPETEPVSDAMPEPPAVVKPPPPMAEPPEPVVQAQPKTQAKTENRVSQKPARKPRPVNKPPRPPKVAKPPVNQLARVSPVSDDPAPVRLADAAESRPPAPTVSTTERQHYLAALVAAINRNKFYPRASRRRAEQGQVVVSFVIQRNGELSDLAIVESSGYERLDEAALKTLRRTTPFKPFPPNVQRDSWPIKVPIAFSLKR